MNHPTPILLPIYTIIFYIGRSRSHGNGAPSRKKFVEQQQKQAKRGDEEMGENKTNKTIQVLKIEFSPE